MKASFAAIFRRGGCKAELFGTTAATAGGGGGGGGSGGGGAAAPSSAAAQAAQQQQQQEPVAADALLVSRKLDELCAAWSQPRGGRGMAAGVWRPEAGAVEVVSKGKHTFQSIGFWARPPGSGSGRGDAAADAAAAAAATTTDAAAAAATPAAASARRLYLHIEDAVTMLDAGELMLFAEEKEEREEEELGGAGAAPAAKRRRRREAPSPRLRLLSLQEAHRLSAGPLRVSGARLALRAHLGRLGYAVGRFPARWALRAGEEPGAPWRGERGGGWAACDGRAGEQGVGVVVDRQRGGGGGVVADSKRRRVRAPGGANDEPAEAAPSCRGDGNGNGNGGADLAPPAAPARRGWWPAVGDEAHPWLSCGPVVAAGDGGRRGPGGGGGHGQPPPHDLPAELSVPNWRYESWLLASAAAAGIPPPALPLPPRDASALPDPGRALAERFPLLRPLRALADEELGLSPPPAATVMAAAARGAPEPPPPPPPPVFSPAPRPLLPVLYDVHAASASFSARDPGRPAFRAGLAPEGEAAASWALPTLRDVAASEAAAEAEAFSARGGGGPRAGLRPVPVRWAAVLAGGDVAFFSVEGARLLDQLNAAGVAGERGEGGGGGRAAAAGAGTAATGG